LNVIHIVAQTSLPSAATTRQVDPPWYANQFIPIILLVIVFYAFMFRSKKGQESKRKNMLSAMKKGDEVQTIGGEFGRVVDTRDDRVLLKVDETSNTKIWYARSAIHRVVTGEKTETK
jgi:preprotein translocase subunit YajC